MGVYGAEQLLSIKNEDWLDSNDSPLTARQFKAKLTFESVVVSADENFTFWFSDGDMFGGHGIEISRIVHLKDLVHLFRSSHLDHTICERIGHAWILMVCE